MSTKTLIIIVFCLAVVELLLHLDNFLDRRDDLTAVELLEKCQTFGDTLTITVGTHQDSITCTVTHDFDKWRSEHELQ